MEIVKEKVTKGFNKELVGNFVSFRTFSSHIFTQGIVTHVNETYLIIQTGLNAITFYMSDLEEHGGSVNVLKVIEEDV